MAYSKDFPPDFPFLVDEATIRHVSSRRSQVMFILRGLSGSGKSFIVSLLEAKYSNTDITVCSANTYFTNAQTGMYKFVPGLIGEAHDQSKLSAKKACSSGKAVVVIDNTHVCRWEMLPYLDLADQHGYAVVIVIPQTPWAFDPPELARKTIHGVRVDLMRRKLQEFETVLPTYWGWFLNKEDSSNLLKMGRKYLEICFAQIQPFQVYLKTQCGIDALSLLSHFGANPKFAGQLHCTAFYAGSSRPGLSKAQSYGDQENVRKSMGKAFDLEVIGFIFTPRTVGARILLNKSQMLLWDNSYSSGADRPRTGHAAYRGGSAGRSDRYTGGSDRYEGPGCRPSYQDNLHRACQNVRANRFPRPDQNRWQGSVGSETSTENMFAALRLESPTDLGRQPTGRPIPRPRGSNAHITLYVAPGERPFAAGEDAAEIVASEEEGGEGGDPPLSVEGGTISHYGEGRCVVHLDAPIVIPTLFTGKYEIEDRRQATHAAY